MGRSEGGRGCASARRKCSVSLVAHVPKAFSLSSSHGTFLSINEATVPETRQDGSQQRIQKNEERLRNLQDIFKHSNIQIIGVPEGREEEQEIENLFEKIMKENVPNLA